MSATRGSPAGSFPEEHCAAAELKVPALRDPAAAGAGFGELRAGELGVRVAEHGWEIEAAQALRWQVFYEEMGARPGPDGVHGRDVDRYDAVADHLLVVDHALGEGPESVVGTYRLIRQEAAERLGGFYSADEYDLSRLLAYPGRILELGRSCVEQGHRSRGTLQLLWRGIAAYVAQHRIELMFGCASLPGTDLDALAEPLTFLASSHMAPPHMCPRALPHRYGQMLRMDPAALDGRAVFNDLPPLIKGYLRLGGFVGDGAVVDDEFNTTDVCVVVRTEQVTEKYSKHYDRR